MGDAKTSDRVQLSRAARHEEWLQLYVGGATYAAIAQRYKVTKGSVREVIVRALAEARKARAEIAAEALDLQLERYDMLYRAHMPVALKPTSTPEDAYRSARIVLQTMDRQNKLLGLEQPQQIEATVRVRDSIDDEVMRLVDALKENAGEVDTPTLDALCEPSPEVPGG